MNESEETKRLEDMNMTALRKSVTRSSRRKDTHINFRASPAEKKLVSDAARAESLDTGTYVRRSVLKQAELDLSVRNAFAVSEEKMAEFLEALDRPVQKKSKLKTLLLEDTVLD